MAAPPPRQQLHPEAWKPPAPIGGKEDPRKLKAPPVPTISPNPEGYTAVPDLAPLVVLQQ